MEVEVFEQGLLFEIQGLLFESGKEVEKEEEGKKEDSDQLSLF